jgi:hypothetical protein
VSRETVALGLSLRRAWLLAHMLDAVLLRRDRGTDLGRSVGRAGTDELGGRAVHRLMDPFRRIVWRPARLEILRKASSLS